jgi:hypothetical protein
MLLQCIMHAAAAASQPAMGKKDSSKKEGGDPPREPEVGGRGTRMNE